MMSFRIQPRLHGLHAAQSALAQSPGQPQALANDDLRPDEPRRLLCIADVAPASRLVQTDAIVDVRLAIQRVVECGRREPAVGIGKAGKVVTEGQPRDEPGPALADDDTGGVGQGACVDMCLRCLRAVCVGLPEEGGQPSISIEGGVHDGSAQPNALERLRRVRTHDSRANCSNRSNVHPGDAPEQWCGIDDDGSAPLVPVAAQLGVNGLPERLVGAAVRQRLRDAREHAAAQGLPSRRGGDVTTGGCKGSHAAKSFNRKLICEDIVAGPVVAGPAVLQIGIPKKLQCGVEVRDRRVGIRRTISTVPVEEPADKGVEVCQHGGVAGACDVLGPGDDQRVRAIGLIHHVKTGHVIRAAQQYVRHACKIRGLHGRQHKTQHAPS
eukprot:m.20351 g.20351  ORF g.20351 m.20351 type:complete len:382 (+) comp3523_c0_seq2:49-1194(+)